MKNSPITVQTTIQAPVSKVWEYWTNPDHIVHWAFASDDWHAPEAENDVRVGGSFKTVMAAKDGSTQFDFVGTYTAVEEQAQLEYDFGPRHATILFEQTADGVTKVTETFDPEEINDLEKQRQGWQAILDNFKKYVESH